MTTTTVSAWQFANQVSAYKRAADAGPVVITHKDEPKYVLLSYEHYQELANRSTMPKPARKRAKPVAVTDSAQLEMVFS